MEKLDKIVEKIDKLDSRMDDMAITLVRNTESLEHHIARTNLLEDYVKTEITPIKKHVDMVKHGAQGVIWVAVALAGLAGFLVTLRELGIFSL
jgi:tetrahydromethanopterin S-methyltransferase subunit B